MRLKDLYATTVRDSEDAVARRLRLREHHRARDLLCEVEPLKQEIDELLEAMVENEKIPAGLYFTKMIVCESDSIESPAEYVDVRVYRNRIIDNEIAPYIDPEFLEFRFRTYGDIKLSEHYIAGMSTPPGWGYQNSCMDKSETLGTIDTPADLDSLKKKFALRLEEQLKDIRREIKKLSPATAAQPS